MGTYRAKGLQPLQQLGCPLGGRGAGDVALYLLRLLGIMEKKNGNYYSIMWYIFGF